MATTKIATLAIRTLAKPIATQIKHQAQNHARFRSICIGLAQFMHRTEVALRGNLFAPASPSQDGEEKPKVRPLNEAKAIANGSNFLAEAFLFALAATLIIGESYRGSRSRAKQRDRTEEGLEELRLITRALADQIGVNFEEIQKKAKEVEEQVHKDVDKDGDQDAAKSEDDSSPSMAEIIFTQRQQLERDRDRLQHAVNVLLRMALKSGWIQGTEALHLQSILDGTDEHHKDGKEKSHPPDGEQVNGTTSFPAQSVGQAPSDSPILERLRALQSGGTNIVGQ